jgi:hypothetical protein
LGVVEFGINSCALECADLKFHWTDYMKIKIESEKIVKAVKKLEGIEIVLENLNDAKEAIQLILDRSGLLEKLKGGKFIDVKVTALQKYETTAVDYKMIFLLEFMFEADVSLSDKVAVIKELQDFFNKI